MNGQQAHRKWEHAAPLRHLRHEVIVPSAKERQRQHAANHAPLVPTKETRVRERCGRGAVDAAVLLIYEPPLAREAIKFALVPLVVGIGDESLEPFAHER